MLKSTKLSTTFSSFVGRIFCMLPLKPNHYTFLSVLLALLGTAVVIAYRAITWALILFVLAFFMDAVDGAVARKKGMVSAFGAFADGVADRLVETLFLISLAFANVETLWLPSWMWIMVVMAFGTYMTSFIKAYAHHRNVLEGKEAERIPGILERAERCVLLLAVMALQALGYGRYAGMVLMMTALLALVTSAQRYLYVWKKACKQKTKYRNKLKQVIVVRSDVKMGKGKLAAQVAHASLEAFMRAQEEKKRAWLNSGQKKVVLKVKNYDELLQLYRKARKKGIDAVLIRDAGLTQLEKGTVTALAAGPEEEEKLNEIFGELKLL